MNNFISPCNHADSQFSGSTVESMINRAKGLGLDYFTCTDPGMLTSILKGYYYAKKKDIKFIAGIEIFFRDDSCNITRGTESEKIKYFKLLLHFKDQEAYQKLVKLSSDKKRRTVQIKENSFPLFDWSDLEDIATTNTSVCTSDIEGMVSKHLLVGRPDLSVKYYEKLRKMFGADNFYPSLIPYVQDKYWDAVVEVNLGDKTVFIPANDRIETNIGTRHTAIELTYRATKHKQLLAVNINNIRYPVASQYRAIVKSKLLNEFQDLPEDLQTKANKLIKALATKNGDLDRLLVNDNSYYANEDDKVVQDMKLGEETRIYQKQFMRSSEDIVEYFHSTMHIDLFEIEKLIENSTNWAKKFDSFSLDYDYKLVKGDGVPEEEMMSIIKKVGRMDWTNSTYVQQFREERELLINNGVLNLIPYFLPIVDVFEHYRDNGHLVGPARGSAGGFLISYLMGVTQIDPIKYGLYSSRFLTIGRIQQGNLPDIDVDLESRDLLVGKKGNSGYLKEKYGNRYAQCSTRTLLRVKSAILDANRFVNKGKVDPDVKALSKSLPPTPQGISDQDFIFGYENNEVHEAGLIELNKDLKQYSIDRPVEWNIVTRALSISRQNSRHACFAAGTLVDSNGDVGFIDELPEFSNNKPITTWYSGVQDTVIVSMNNGVSIKCTPDHEFIINGKKIEAKDLVGENISYSPFTNTGGSEYYSEDYCFAWGWFLNDGAYIKPKDSTGRFEFYFTPEKDDLAKNRILNFLRENNIKVTADKKRPDTFKAYNLDINFKINQKTFNKRLPREFWSLNEKSQKSFMKGLFSGNGYVLSTRPTVAIKLTSKLLISDIAIWLNSKEVETSCSYSKPVNVKHHNGDYVSRSTGTLTIPHVSNKKKFRELVGFEQKYKNDRLNEIIEIAKNTKYEKGPMKCLAIEESGSHPVWDFNEPLENVGYINGCLVSNCAYVIADRPIEDVVAIMEVGGVERVTQPEHKQCEEAGLVKYDFLVVNAVKDARIAMDYINRKNNDNNMETGYFMHNGVKTYIWDLPEDPDVFAMMGDGATETIFQLNTTSVTPVVKAVNPNNITDCATITSLVRPGPLDFIDEKTGRNMVEEFIERKFGRSKSDIPILMDLIPETYGVLVFQEQVTYVARELAGMTVEESENVRIAMGKKKIKLLNSLKPIFIDGAIKKVDKETAEKIWNMMATFARYGFNKCLSGDTVLLRNKCGSKTLTISEMYKAKNDISWAKENNRESVGKKYRSQGYGKGVSKKGDRLFPNNIVDIRFEGVRDVYKITTENGKTIKSTDNHKYPTPKGEVMLMNLEVGDSLYVNNLHEVSDNTYRFDEGNNLPVKGQKGLLCGEEKIVSIELIGKEEVYDVEMESPYHNFVTETGIVTCNSHAVAYSVISYACAFMKYHYTLEWWAAVLTNAKDKEINEVFYKYIKDMVLPPDINLSDESILIDYNQGKLRNKLSMISGLGTKVANKIIDARPYTDINDFVSKKVCGPSLTKKLIHVGVLDSLFDLTDDLESKMCSYENALNLNEHNKKLVSYDSKITQFKLAKDEKGIKRAEKNKLKFIEKGVKGPTIDEKYETLTPKDDFLLKKSVFPAINLNLKDVLDRNSDILQGTDGHFKTIINKYKKQTPIFTGELLQAIDDRDMKKDMYCCVPAYVMNVEEFTFQGDKKALKLILDSSGYISEKVIWPDYNTGELIYDKKLKKGAIAWFFYAKKVDKKYNNITQTIIEQESIL